MVEASSNRPMRLWAAAIINISFALVSIGFFAFLFSSASIPQALRPSVAASAIAICTASFLFVASVFALLGKPYGRYLMLAAVILFYGIIIIQNVFVIAGAQTWLSLSAVAKPVTNVVGASMQLLFGAWALL
ncbi:MAG: hypothetical protein ACRD5Z_24490, partial [Bryobacteraceae bacterium]